VSIPFRRLKQSPRIFPLSHIPATMSADDITPAPPVESRRSWELPVGVWDQHNDLFDVHEELARGGQARIVRVTYRGDNHEYIFKVYNERATGQLESELLAAIKGHPNLVYQERFLDNFPEPGLCSLLLRHCDQGDLLHYLDQNIKAQTAISEMFIWKVFAQLVDALAYLHYGVGTDGFDENEPYANPHRIVHRDIKPENIFLFSKSGIANRHTANGGIDPLPSLKLGDFGLSRPLPDREASFHGWRGGTPAWQPPEQIVKPFISGPAQDIWAVGAIIHAMALGGAPIDTTQGDPKLLEKGASEYDQTCPRKVQDISKRPEERENQWKELTSCTKPWGRQYSRRLNFYMAQCLTTDPALRPTAWTLSRTMGQDFKKVAARVGDNPVEFERKMMKWSPPGESRPTKLRKMLKQVGDFFARGQNLDITTR
jgi:serine/threonine protein kinase